MFGMFMLIAANEVQTLPKPPMPSILNAASPLSNALTLLYNSRHSSSDHASSTSLVPSLVSAIPLA